MIRLDNAAPGHVPNLAGLPPAEPATARSPRERRADRRATRPRPWWWHGTRLPRWMYRGYTEVNASDMAAAVAFNTLIALVPTFLLVTAVAGLFLKNDEVLQQARLVIVRLAPGDAKATNDAFTAALGARNNSGWLGLVSFIGFAWVGTGFVSCLARSMNRIYGVRNSGYINEKQRGFLVIFVFSLLFIVSLFSTIVTTFFVNQDLPDVFQPWLLATGEYQILGYAIGLVSAVMLFITIYRIVPNAGQHLADVWPGAVVASVLFVVVTQVFPIYIRVIGGTNRYGQAIGLVSLLVLSLLALAHVILFGAYTNATWQRRRRRKSRERRIARAERFGTDPMDDEDFPDAATRV